MRTGPYQALALALLVTGCAATQWVGTGYGSKPIEQALAECEYESSAAVASIRSGIEAAFEKVTLRNKCMIAKGFRLVRQ